MDNPHCISTFSNRKANGNHELLSSQDYYYFGMQMPNRGTSVSENDYRFGFNGMEKVDEWTGSKGSHLDFEARIYDSRIGRWLSPDPYFKEYVPISPFAFALNSPIKLLDADGNVVVDENGNEVTVTVTENKDGSYSASFNFVEGTSNETINAFNSNGGRIIKSMIQVQTGRDKIEDVQKSTYKTHYVYDNSKKGSGNKLGYTLGSTIPKAFLVYDEEGKPTGVETGFEVTIYEKNIKELGRESLEDMTEGSMTEEREFRENKLTLEQKIGSVGTHETVYTTREYDIELLKQGKTMGKDDPEHKPAYKAGSKATQEFGTINKEKNK